MFPPFIEEKALEKCRWLIARLDAGEVELRQLAPVSGERAGQGLMLAAMIAREGEGGPDRLFFACSGLSRQLFVVSGILELYYAQNFEKAYIDYVENDMIAYVNKCDQELLGGLSKMQGILSASKMKPRKNFRYL